MAHVNAPHAPMLAYLDGQVALSPLAHVVLGVAVTVNKWQTMRNTRRALAQIDDHLLDDIGLERHEAFIESRRKFWQV